MWRKLATLVLTLVIPGLAGCDTGTAEEARAEHRQPAPAPVAPAPAAHRDERNEGPLVIFLGDSLTAGQGLAEDQAYPAVLDRRLDAEGMPARVLNAGVSGDTTAGGLARLGWLLKQKPDVLVVGLGANDGLRGLDLGETEKNLREIVRRGKASGARVLLLGMMIPPNYGPDYTEQFRDIYPRIAKDLDVPLVPFLLDKVGGLAELNQADGVHPTARGQEMVADNVEPYLVKLLPDGSQERDVRLSPTRTGADDVP
ncbi:MAG TPA: arylesterase [Thermoanaerobaculia bacterium]|nr:arylesterase [Thermoanaerobaculia bacterium]